MSGTNSSASGDSAYRAGGPLGASGSATPNYRESPSLARAATSAPSVLRFCVDCGLAIAPDRIAAVPSANRCLECQTRYESIPAAAPAFSALPPNVQRSQKES